MSDHSKYVEKYRQNGVPIFEPYKGGKQNATLGDFKIWAFPLEHDGVENRGVLVHHEEMGYLLYLTDLEYCSFTFEKYKVQHIICEANYSKEFVDNEKANYEHVLRGHLSIEECVKFLEVNKTEKLQDVFLAHLSPFNSDEGYFIEQAQKIVSCPIYVAHKGLEIELKNADVCPFWENKN